MSRFIFYYFSPTGGTKKAGEALCHGMEDRYEAFDMILHEGEGASYFEEDIVVFAAPVYSGRIPEYVSKFMSGLHGSRTRAIVMAVYGTRAYEDALVEMQDVIQQQGFQVIAGITAIAQHTFSEKVGYGRPDLKDKEELAVFGQRVRTKLEQNDRSTVNFPGDRPYREVTSSETAVQVNDHCISCGKCVAICPQKAISEEDYTVREKERCILCEACMTACPVGARYLPEDYVVNIQERLKALEGLRRENTLLL